MLKAIIAFWFILESDLLRSRLESWWNHLLIRDEVEIFGAEFWRFLLSQFCRTTLDAHSNSTTMFQPIKTIDQTILTKRNESKCCSLVVVNEKLEFINFVLCVYKLFFLFWFIEQRLTANHKQSRAGRNSPVFFTTNVDVHTMDGNQTQNIKKKATKRIEKFRLPWGMRHIPSSSANSFPSST